MAVAPPKLLRELRRAFHDTQTTMSALHPAVQIRPNSAEEIVQLTGSRAGSADFECRPVVCFIPERAGMSTADVYVVFQGILTLLTDSDSAAPSTGSYSTNFGYFKMSEAGVLHAFGGHYDFVEGDITHPRAHMQLRSQAAMWDRALERFPSLKGVAIEADGMAQVFNRVRAPSAQMDFLSFMIQIAADHLVDGKSARGPRAEFKALTSRCSPFHGYAVPPRHEGWECHRGGHWYPQT